MSDRYWKECLEIWDKSWSSNLSNKAFRRLVREKTEKLFGEHSDKPNMVQSNRKSPN